MEYGIVRLDKIVSGKVGHIHSVVYDADILENGMVGVVGDLLEDERELKEFVAPTGTTQKVALIAHPEINYDESRRTSNSLQNFFQPAGKPTRAYDLADKDMFSVSKKMVKALADDVVVGNFVTTEAGSFVMAEVASDADQAFLAKIVGKEKLGTSTVVGQAGTIARIIDLVVVEVVRNRD